jgi:hypothetical protein
MNFDDFIKWSAFRQPRGAKNRPDRISTTVALLLPGSGGIVGRLHITYQNKYEKYILQLLR